MALKYEKFNICYELDVDSNETVCFVKTELSEKINLAVNNIELIFKCKTLENNLTINDYNILPEDFISFILYKQESDFNQIGIFNGSIICCCGQYEGETCKFRPIYVYIANFEKRIIYKIWGVVGKSIKDAIQNSNFKNFSDSYRLFYNTNLIDVDQDFIHYGFKNGDIFIQSDSNSIFPDDLDSSRYQLMGFNAKNNLENVWINLISKTHDFAILQPVKIIQISSLIEKICEIFDVPDTQVKLFQDIKLTTEATQSDIDMIMSGKSKKKFWITRSDSQNPAKEGRRRSYFQYSVIIYFSLVANFENLIRQEVIGKGSYGTVYKCFDIESGRTFALKKFKISGIDNEQCQELKNEIDILLAVRKNPRIVNFERKIIVNNSIYLLMEYVHRGSLRTYLSKNGPLEESRIATFSRQILEALKYLHSLKIIHRDVKGDNVLLDMDYNVKLGDFGLSKCYKGVIGTDTFNKGAANSFVGTCNYMAPEVISEKKYGSQADIWSLGATVVEMVTGKPPYHNSEFFYVIYKLGTEKKIEFEWPPNITEALKDFMGCCLKSNPSERLTVDRLLEHDFLKNN